MIIRKYKSLDCKYLAELFYQTVHTINTNDYTKEQLDVWAYVHKDYQHQGIATAICDKLEREVCAGKIVVHASITAKQFFISRGYKVIKEQQVVKKGISLTNYVMEKSVRIAR